MEKEEADLLHLKCKTENPVEKIIRHKNNDRKTRFRRQQFCASVIRQGIRLPWKTIVPAENEKRDEQNRMVPPANKVKAKSTERKVEGKY